MPFYIELRSHVPVEPIVTCSLFLCGGGPFFPAVCDPSRVWISCLWGIHKKYPFPTRQLRIQEKKVINFSRGLLVGERHVKLCKNCRTCLFVLKWRQVLQPCQPCQWLRLWWGHIVYQHGEKPSLVKTPGNFSGCKKHPWPLLAIDHLCSLNLCELVWTVEQWWLLSFWYVSWKNCTNPQKNWLLLAYFCLASLLLKKNLSRLIFKLFVCSLLSTWSRTLRWSSWVCVCTNKSSMLTRTFEIFLSTPSIKGWKLAGQPSRTIGDVIQWYCPWPEIANAVRCCDFSSSCICQNPDITSRVEKRVELALPMSPIHSVISFMEYLSMWELFSSRKSWTTRKPWPCFLGTQKIGEL